MSLAAAADARPTPGELADLYRLLGAALAEDLGPDGIDLAAPAVRGVHAQATVVARAAGTVCGMAAITHCARLGGIGEVSLLASDADAVEAGTPLATLGGDAAAILAAERTMLNVLGRLSGTATLTRAFVDAVGGSAARILDTRKTTPGMRSLQRWAVRCGGGHNHRFGLHDEAMVKDNHADVAGGIRPAVERIRAAQPAARIHVEARTLDEVDAALASCADVVMLDNMALPELARAVTRIAGRGLTEASGGVTLATVAAIAATGVDRISIGVLTHSAPILDVALDVSPPPARG